MENVFVEDSLGEVLTALNNTRLFGFDLETTGLNPLDSRILLAQLSLGDINYVIDARKLDLSPLMPFMADDGWKKVIHQEKFEQKFIQHFYKHQINGVFDTMLAEALLNPDSRGYVSLQHVAGKYLGRTLNKEERESFFNHKGRFTDEQIAYAAEDVEILPAIMELQAVELTKNDLNRVAQVEFDLGGVVASMELTGIPIDKEMWMGKVHEYEGKHEDSRLRLHEILFDEGGLNEQTAIFERDAINLNSPQQIMKAFEGIGIKIPMVTGKDGKKKKSVDERALQMIDHKAAKELLNYRGYQKIMTSYSESFLDKIHPFDNRIHPEFQQLGTETGRFSCKEPNMQQLPAAFRQCVRSDEFMVISADYANIELRILAELSKDPMLTRAFIKGEDPHRATAASMFNIPLDSVTKEQRFIAKTINFGISYGMGTKKLMDTLNEDQKPKDKLNFTEVNRLHTKYKNTYAGAMRWLEEAGRKGFRHGSSSTILGRKRFFTRPNSEELEPKEYDRQLQGLLRQAANSPIQGSNADITKLAMVRLDERLRDEGWRANLIIQVHDEIVLLAHKKQADNVMNIVKETMQEAAADLIKSVPIKVDCVIGDSWNK